MINSPTCLNRRRRIRHCALLFACLLPVLQAIDPLRNTSQYVSTHWSTEQGFPPGPVYAINQTPDGYLWIGTEKGLVRFDGLAFRLMTQDRPGASTITHVLGLTVDRDGGLWARLRRPAVLRFQNGQFRDAMADLGHLELSVAQLARGWNGDLLFWALDHESTALSLHNGKLGTIADLPGFSRAPALALAQTPNGDIWVGTRDAGLYRLRGTSVTAIRDGLPDPKVNTLIPMADNKLWIGTDGGVVQWDGHQLSTNAVPPELQHIEALSMAVDRDSNLWVGTNARGLLRFNGRSVVTLDEPGGTRNAITAIFEDREGSLWIGSGSGLERLRDSAFVTYSRAEGLPTDGNNPLFVDAEDRLWFSPVSGGLWWTKGGIHHQVTGDGIQNDIVYSIAQASGSQGKDVLWLGRQHGGLTRLNLADAHNPLPGHADPRFPLTTYRQTNGLAQDSVYAVYQTRRGTVWAGTLSGGVSHLVEGKFTTYTTADGLASNSIKAILEDARDNIWLGTPTGISVFSQGRWKTYKDMDGLPSDDVNCLLQDSTGIVWVGTAAGLAYKTAGSGNQAFRIPPNAPATLREPVMGLAADQLGYLWLSTSAHVVRVNRTKLMQGTLAEGDLREYGLADGLRGVEGVKRFRSVVSDAHGRVWFSMNRGISVVDPGRLASTSAPALPQIQAILVDGTPVPLSGTIHVAGGSHRVSFRYAGLSLADPESVRFRYQLEGFDRGWSDPGSATDSIYTNLPPGPYRFRVMASNADGVWSPSEAAVAFDVDPLFWQTAWFRGLLLGSLVLAAIALYRVRVGQVTRQLNIRFDERLTERTRIAQELHDTLLQGFLSASMQVHVAADLLPEESRIKPMLGRSLELMRQVIDEGRNTVRGLRSSTNGARDLEHAFSRVLHDVAPTGDSTAQAKFRVIVDGQPRPLHPLIRDEVYRIGREALINAFRHSQAATIDLELRYSARHLCLQVRDDGRGIDPHILESGRDGHWGLSGMRERADRIGAQFHVWSRAASGTEVELTIAGHLAFQDHQNYPLAWLRRPFQGALRGSGSRTKKGVRL